MRIRAFFLSLLAVCTFPALGLTRSWTGAASANWSDPANWSPAGTPAPADKLIFPAGIAQTTLNNDLPAWTSFDAMDFRIGYTVNGNPLVLTGDLTFDQSSYPWFYWNVDTRLGNSVRFGAAINSRYGGAIDVNGQTLTIDAYNTTIAGALQGSGAILINGSGITITGAGTFSGTITGTVDVRAALPDAAIDGSLAGTGPVGSVSATSGLYPGGKPPCCADTHTVGTLDTESISIPGPAFFDLAPGSASDQLRVTGTVTLGGNLVLYVAAGSPGAGESFTLIDNDGADAVSGTFAGLAEGAAITLGSASLSLSYHGGDGNDVVLTTASAAKQWTGAVSELWSNPANWSPAAIPASGEPLVFPAGVTRTTMTNDLASWTSVGAMDFRTTYTLNGNPLTLTGDLSFDQATYTTFTCNVATRLGASVRFGEAITSYYNGAIDVNGHTLVIDAYNTTVGGTLDGTGSIFINGSGIRSNGGGSFSGTITGTIDVHGSLPAASIAGTLSGIGSVGSVSATGGLYPGGKPPCCADPHIAGTLQTGSIAISAPMFADLVPGGASDLVQVTGTVTIGGTLIVSVASGAPGAGESYTLIDNDGADAVSGAFSNLAEGATVTLNGATLTLTYHGGDGNDVVLSTAAATKSWTGAISELWSEPGNWSPASIPATGEALIFPAGVARNTMTNDLPAGRRVGPLDFRAGYTLNGNALTLGGDLTFDQTTYPNFVCNVDLKVAEAITLGAAISSTYTGAIDVNGEALTIAAYNTRINGAVNGTGKIIVQGPGLTIDGDGTFEGRIIGTVQVRGALQDANVEGGPLSGDGTVGKITLPDGPLYLGAKEPCCADTHLPGTLQSRSVELGGPLLADITPDASDQLKVTGKVTLGGTLHVTVPSGSPAAGQDFTLIDNDGGEAVDGTFEDLPEDAIVTAGPWQFRVHYAGGDGNDVVLSAIDPTVTEGGQNAATTRFGEGATFTARVTSRSGATPSGTVTFTDNNVVLGTAPLAGGVASFAATLDPGDHTIGAQFAGTELFAPSNSLVTHKVLRGRTAISINTFGPSMIYGRGEPLQVGLLPIAPATEKPSGVVTLMVDDKAAATANLDHGNAVIDLSSVDAGTHTLRIAYAGDSRFESTDSTGLAFTVLKAQTIVSATSAQNTLSIRVGASMSPRRVAGNVSVSENGVVLAEQPLAAGEATIALPQLATGEHLLTVRYVGTGNYEPSSTDLTVAVDIPQISVSDAVVAEGDAGEKSVTMRVELSWPTPQTVTVAYTTADRNATEGQDYRGARGTLTFAPYELVKTIEVPVYGDTSAEADERLDLTLSEPQNATLGHGRGTVLISNDDLPYRALLGIPYGNGLTLDLYTPVEGSSPFPLIVWIPGGAAYDATGSFAPALRQTARGYAVATVRYHAPAASARFPAQLDDLRAALAWLRANAAQYTLDPQRIGVWGASAGAHLASLVGVNEPVQAVVAWGGASDFAHLQEDASSASCNTNFNDRSSAQSGLIGCSLTSCPQKAATASPVNFATADDAAFLLVHGTGDCVVPPMQSTRLHDALAAAGAKSTLKLIAGGAPSTWTSAEANDLVDSFLDRELKSPTKRRTVRR